MRAKRRAIAALAGWAALVAAAPPAAAARHAPYGTMELVIGLGPSTFTSTWAHLRPALESKGCEDALELDLRLKLNTGQVSDRDVDLRTLTLEWKAKTAGFFAGYGMWSGKKTYMGGRYGQLADPEVRVGAGDRTVAINRTVGVNGKLFWRQNFSFEEENFGAGFGGPQGTSLNGCLSHSIWYHIKIVRRGGDVGCSSIPARMDRELHPTGKC